MNLSAKSFLLKKALLFLFISFFAKILNAQTINMRTLALHGNFIYKEQNDQYAAGIPTNIFEYFAAPETSGKQRQNNWCWAACIQMSLNCQGILITQEFIVKKVFGEEVDKAGSSSDIYKGLYGNYIAANGAKAFVMPIQPALLKNIWNQSLEQVFFSQLSLGKPLIIGRFTNGNSIGHAYVVTALYYHYDLYGNGIIDYVVLRDPWPGSTSRVEVSWSVINNEVPTDFIFVLGLGLVR